MNLLPSKFQKLTFNERVEKPNVEDYIDEVETLTKEESVSVLFVIVEPGFSVHKPGNVLHHIHPVFLFLLVGKCDAVRY